MSKPSKYFSGEGPERPHLSKGEVADLRRDVEEAFQKVETDVIASGFVSAIVDAADVTGGGTTQTVGLQLKDASGNPVAQEITLEFAVFNDAELSIPAINAILSTATSGVIVAGDGTAALKIKTDAMGLFECTLTDAVDETVYLGCSMTFGSPMVDCQSNDSVTFS
jgi:hypothetical protein